MGSYFIKRVIQAVFLLKLVMILVFLLLHMTGDPVLVMMDTDATREDIAEMRKVMGFDQPLWVQYGRFFKGALRGDFGESIEHGESAMGLVLEHFPATLEMALGAFLFAAVIGIPFGCLAAFKEGSLYDKSCVGITVLIQAIPDFWLAIMFIMFFSVFLGILPSFGRGGWQHFIMPAFAASTYHLARLARLMRSQMLEVMRQDYIKTARSKGLNEKVILMVHALKNSAIPIVTVLGLDLGILLGGTVIIEVVFAWPGVGRLVIEAISNRDFPIVQSAVFLMASGFVLINLTVDLLYAYLDPRISYS
ncbi:MAG: ABC transporter permease [Nitrospinaceae bacterium]|jgi:peptide/nickel transport system permease protein|nr:ABC transporter permease [Nitrospinaceae bacterium]MBT3433332.1 ABC transporter permease [Nitrospinaceae bacterium]MBT4093788.1 ABC transporter permease [Nitrospinaceae bacterium]MBT4429555.1 ABC transporter permease [Nitrospinaceae bacterium]MBT5367795.1 ABC transporter permease [Nitrospinaceae bacterium]